MKKKKHSRATRKVISLTINLRSGVFFFFFFFSQGRTRRGEGMISGYLTIERTFSLLAIRVTPVFTKKVCIGNSMIGINTTSDISKLLYVISRAVRRVRLETILKYHEWYLYQISGTIHAIICLYYYPRKVCNFHT